MKTPPRTLILVDIAAILLLSIATGMVFFYAPVEIVMGPVQKIFYFHVAAGWVGMLGFLVAAVAGIFYLRTDVRRWDVLGFASVEIGMVFALVNVITGSIWARPIWNTWWTWDPRLTTATVMILIYAAYFLLRGGIEDIHVRARFGAVYTLLGFLSVPLTFLSARLFRTIHPILIGANQPGTASGLEMSSRMLQTFLLSLLAFTVVFISLLWHRVRLGELTEEIQILKFKSSE